LRMFSTIGPEGRMPLRLIIWISELIYMFGPRRYAKTWLNFWFTFFPNGDALLRQRLLVLLALSLALTRSAVRRVGGLDAALRQMGPIDIHWITEFRNLLFYLVNYVDTERTSVFMVPQQLVPPIRALIPDDKIIINNFDLGDSDGTRATNDTPPYPTQQTSTQSTLPGMRLFVRGQASSQLSRIIKLLSDYGCAAIVNDFPLAEGSSPLLNDPDREDWQRAVSSFDEAKLRYLPRIDAYDGQSVLFIETPLERYGSPDVERTRSTVLPVLQQLIDGGFPLAWKCEIENSGSPLLADFPFEERVRTINAAQPTELVCEYFDVIVTFASQEVAFNHHSKIYLIDDLTAWRGSEPEAFRRAANNLRSSSYIKCSRLTDLPLDELMRQWGDARFDAAIKLENMPI
jgi:hypothetical protein